MKRTFVPPPFGALHASNSPGLRFLRRRRCAGGHSVCAQRDVERRRQPDLRRRGQRGRELHQRLRRALQPRRHGRGSQRLDDSVRVGVLDELAGNASVRLDRPGPLLPRAARLDGVCRLAPAGRRRDRYDEPRERGRQGRARARRDSAHVRRVRGKLLERAARRGSRRLRLRDRLRGCRPGSGAQQHNRRSPCGRWLHRHERECERLHGR
jgi:hypothetical protein